MHKLLASIAFNEHGDIIESHNVDTSKSGLVHKQPSYSFIEKIKLRLGLMEEKKPEPLVGNYCVSFREPMKDANYSVSVKGSES